MQLQQLHAAAATVLAVRAAVAAGLLQSQLLRSVLYSIDAEHCSIWLFATQVYMLENIANSDIEQQLLQGQHQGQEGQQQQ